MNEDIVGYLQKARDCLEDSDYLLSGNRLEASCNRSYYAIFDSIQALLSLTENVYFKTHQGAHIKFRELYLKERKLPIELNEILTEAFALRQGSDYEIEFEISKDKALALFENATKFVDIITDYIYKTIP